MATVKRVSRLRWWWLHRQRKGVIWAHPVRDERGVVTFRVDLS